MSAITKGFSTKQTAKQLKISTNRPTNFIKKVRINVADSASLPMIVNIFVDKFIFSGKENLKQERSNIPKNKVDNRR
ncbi:hypothetical protein [Flavobacterium sp. DSR2-3-3]|uniref:hypothetical protein n=1 Tax=Flavobacterium sp. DSR2-3-3 TaxID=2804632 RepID=UPI003CF8F35C